MKLINSVISSLFHAEWTSQPGRRPPVTYPAGSPTTSTHQYIEQYRNDGLLLYNAWFLFIYFFIKNISSLARDVMYHQNEIYHTIPYHTIPYPSAYLVLLTLTSTSLPLTIIMTWIRIYIFKSESQPWLETFKGLNQCHCTWSIIMMKWVYVTDRQTQPFIVIIICIPSQHLRRHLFQTECPPSPPQFLSCLSHGQQRPQFCCSTLWGSPPQWLPFFFGIFLIVWTVSTVKKCLVSSFTWGRKIFNPGWTLNLPNWDLMKVATSFVCLCERFADCPIRTKPSRVACFIGFWSPMFRTLVTEPEGRVMVPDVWDTPSSWQIPLTRPAVSLLTELGQLSLALNKLFWFLK